jgi:RHS repeat-associated protein
LTGGNAAAYGVPAGHWRQTRLTGNARKILIFDALWRPVVEQTLDLGNVSGTTTEVIKRYDASGRLAFQSYPVNTSGLAVYTDTTLKGARTSYDALDRVTQVQQDSEIDAVIGHPLTTTTEYLDGFQTRVTDPNGNQTLTTLYQAYDQPTYDWPRGINHPEGAYTDIYRDVFGKPTAIKRRNLTGTTAVTRGYTYNTYQELCKSTEPETLATLMGYDLVGNLAWSAAGLPTATACDPTGTTAPVLARKATRGYDARNRNIGLAFTGGLGSTTTTYTPDGLPESITADNGGVDLVTTTYVYNKRRLPTSENMTWGSLDWFIYCGYDINGSLASKTSNNLTVDFSPNALGQPTKAGTFATGVSYFPNGAIKQFTYGNGIVHTLTQNTRQLPDRSRDVYGASPAVLDDSYDYDPNGNVLAISDGRSSARGNRTMTYDGLDRLKTIASPMYATTGSGTASYAYDVLNNLTRVAVPTTPLAAARDHTYVYDPTKNLLTNVTNTVGGASVIGIDYLQGNLWHKNNVVHSFDLGNRLRSVSSPATTYIYDGSGRRVGDITGSAKYSLYSRTGELTFVRDIRASKRYDYVTLAGSLVAIRAQDLAGGAFTTSYQHTDALGSPVAVTDASRVVTETSEYEPYGKLLNHAVHDGPGYTGHVSDAATGLSYMQQRYYDPGIGRFLSVDPVSADGNTGGNFNRYWYATNNPYRFTDPDGRQPGDLTTWPVPSHGQINEANKPGEGDGHFGALRMTSNGQSTHSGIDIKAPVGSSVVAAGDGKVVNQQPNPSKTYGNQVVIDHGKGVYTQSAHLDSATVKPGDTVKAGEQIGSVGTTGNTPKAGDPHLHFEVRIGSPVPRSAGGTVVDPLKRLPAPPLPDKKL